jgi:hypothetical protein
MIFSESNAKFHEVLRASLAHNSFIEAHYPRVWRKARAVLVATTQPE